MTTSPVLHLEPARRDRLADILYGQLIERIASGALQEGDRLPSEKAICEEFQVSRPVVREALLRLRADGFIQSRQGSGSYVKSRPPARITAFTDPSAVSGFLRTFEPRIVLESEAARLAAIRRKRSDLEALDIALDQLRQIVETGGDGRAADFQFHLAVATASGNDLFVRLLLTESHAVLGAINMALNLTREGSDSRRNAVLAEHQQIAEAIRASDSENAYLYMRYHLVQARGRLTGLYRDA